MYDGTVILGKLETECGPQVHREDILGPVAKGGRILGVRK